MMGTQRKLLFLFILATLVSVWYLISRVQSFSGPTSRLRSANTCADCREEVINPDHLMNLYNSQWKKKEIIFDSFRSNLTEKCHGLSRAIVTQANTPVGSKVIYDGERTKTEEVTPKLFNTFAKVQPFDNVTWRTCAVVGNGAILTNSSCGKEIDSAQFVIRCNLPPLGEDYEKDVGNETNLVTANPSIFLERFEGLTERRRPFVDSLRIYGNSFLLIPAFSFTRNMAVSLRAVYALEESRSLVRPMFFNPVYLQNLAQFWQNQGLQALRPSTGLIMASLALELCHNVTLYGFWPFPHHPQSHLPLPNHYYDDQQSMKAVHNMPSEFGHLMHLHNRGVLRLRLHSC